MISKLFITLLDILFPRHCFHCHERGSYLCAKCLELFHQAEELETPNSFAVFSYHEPPIKKAIWALKYKGITSLATELSALLYDYFAEELAWRFPQQTKKYLIVPAPASKKHQRQRGYNQAELLARHFAQKDKENFELTTNVLLKIISTPTQVSLKNRQRRLQNLHGAFMVTNPEKISGRQIILIDDVITTGATIAEARRVLKKAGAKQVIALALAHGG